jgi:diguanylate cyclase (GGDEF)-like protein/PAS domain S-box-containing protein
MDFKRRLDDVKLKEIYLLFSAILAPGFLIIWLKFKPGMPIELLLGCWIVSLYFTFSFCLMHLSSFIRRNLGYVLYGGYYLLSLFVIYLAYYYDFSESYSLLLMLVVFYISLTFDKIKALLYYLITVLILMSSVAYVERRYLNIYNNNGLIVNICLLVFSVIVLLNLYIRNGDKNALNESIKDYQRLLDTSPDGIIVYEKENIVYANEALAALAKISDKDEIIGKSVFDILHSKDYNQIITGIEEILKGNRTGYNEVKIDLANNISLDAEVVNKVTTYNGREAIMTIVRDISERKRMQAELIEAEAKYRSIIEGALLGILITKNVKPIYVNEYVERTIGYSAEELYSMDLLTLVDEEYRTVFNESVERLRSGANEIMMSIRVVKKDGSKLFLQVHSRVMDYKGEYSVMSMVLDVTEQKKSEEKIMHMAFYDSVTGLPNRYLLSSRLQETLESDKESNKPTALMFIDFDKFKIINDTLGHSFGDKVLIQASKELRKCLMKDDFISRYGGDEFIILLENTGYERAEMTAINIIKRFSSSLDIEENRIDITPSIGISLYPTDATDAETLVKYADTAMYMVKAQGRNNYKFYKPEMNDEISKTMMMEQDLRKAIERGEFIVHYQPQISLTTGDLIGAEALIRWQHPRLGLVPPDRFIPLAEENGLIVAIGDWILNEACLQSMTWQKCGLRPINMSVNVSYKQLKCKDFSNSVQEALKKSRLKPELLELEITESVLKDAEEFKTIISELESLGVKLAIDDFGVGYSSLSMLQHTAINNLKIDKSFVRSIPCSRKAAAIVKSIIDIGKNLNFQLVAEGIETKVQADFLRENNCDLGQGYLYSRPLPAEEFETFFRNWKGL